MDVPFGLLSLPEELFCLVTQHLDATEIVLCRSVSKTWYNVFANPSFLRAALKMHLGHAREVRQLMSEEAFAGPVGSIGRDLVFWVDTFDRVAARYHALKSGNPQYITKLSQYVIGSGEWPPYHYPISQWEQITYERAVSNNGLFFLEDKEQAWTYDDGLLVYADKGAKCFVLLDIQDTTRADIPFELQGRRIRQVRLCRRVLLIEWDDDTPCHKLDDTESVHRHFVTAFDVVLVLKSLPWLPKWSVIFRNELKLHFLGVGLNQRGRFISVHTATHYAVYIWQTNHSARQRNAPLELLTVWDITQHCEYRPSDDPSGKDKPELGPRVVLKASSKLLDFYGIRQRHRHRFKKLRLDEGEGMVYFHEGVGLSGSGDLSDNKDRSWKYSGPVVGIPYAGVGPCWRSEVCQEWHVLSKGQPSLPSFSLPNQESSTGLVQTYELDRCEDFIWIFNGAQLTGYRDCSAAINFVAGEPDQEEAYPADWLLHIWGDDWNAEVKGSVSDCMKYSRIRGDERWIIGRNRNSDEIVILHFDKKPSEGMYSVLCALQSVLLIRIR